MNDRTIRHTKPTEQVAIALSRQNRGKKREILKKESLRF